MTNRQLRLEWIGAGSLSENPATEAPPEEWRRVPDYEAQYEVSDLGRVRRIGSGHGAKCGRVLRQAPHGGGYLTVSLWKDNRGSHHLVHRLVAAAFLGRGGRGLEVNHRDGDKRNNRLDNLEYVTRQGNIDHAVGSGLIDNKGARNPRAKLTADDIAWIREVYGRGGIGYARLAKRLGLNWGTVRNIVTRRTWDHV